MPSGWSWTLGMVVDRGLQILDGCQGADARQGLVGLDIDHPRPRPDFTTTPRDTPMLYDGVHDPGVGHDAVVEANLDEFSKTPFM